LEELDEVGMEGFTVKVDLMDLATRKVFAKQEQLIVIRLVSDSHPTHNPRKVQFKYSSSSDQSHILRFLDSLLH
jgi:hypothetical protein